MLYTFAVSHLAVFAPQIAGPPGPQSGPFFLQTMTLALAETSAAQATAADPLARAMRWQAVLTALFALAALWLAGTHGAVSALLGGAVSLVAAWAFTWMVRRSRSRQLMDTMVVMLKAEAAKIAVILCGLLACFLLYREVVALALVGAFIVTTLAFSLAAFMAPGAPRR